MLCFYHWIDGFIGWHMFAVFFGGVVSSKMWFWTGVRWFWCNHFQKRHPLRVSGPAQGEHKVCAKVMPEEGSCTVVGSRIGTKWGRYESIDGTDADFKEANNSWYPSFTSSMGANYLHRPPTVLCSFEPQQLFDFSIKSTTWGSIPSSRHSSRWAPYDAMLPWVLLPGPRIGHRWAKIWIRCWFLDNLNAFQATE